MCAWKKYEWRDRSLASCFIGPEPDAVPVTVVTVGMAARVIGQRPAEGTVARRYTTVVEIWIDGGGAAGVWEPGQPPLRSSAGAGEATRRASRRPSECAIRWSGDEDFSRAMQSVTAVPYRAPGPTINGIRSRMAPRALVRQDCRVLGQYDTGIFAAVETDQVRSREDFRDVVAALVMDFKRQGDDWENGDLGRFLEALEGVATDVTDEEMS